MQIIGQKDLFNEVNRWIEKDNIPRFILLSGSKYSGKTYLAKEIAKLISKEIIEVDHKADTIRDMINTAYTISDKVIYIVDNAQLMSESAKNALLKVTEEPPRKAYIVLVVEDFKYIPDTLISRANVLQIKKYSKDEIQNYIKGLDVFKSSDLDMLLDICVSPAEVNYFLDNNLKSFYDLVNTIVLKLDILSGVEAFKLSKKIKLKKDEVGFDLRFVMNKVKTLTLKYELEDSLPSGFGYLLTAITNKGIKDLDITGINQISVFDKWILDIKNIEI